MDLVVVLGKNVRALRQARGMSQEQLAFDADMKRSYVSDLERGTRNPSVRALGRIADALGVTAADLLRGSNGKTEEMAAKDRLDIE